MNFWQMSDGIRLHDRPHHDDGTMAMADQARHGSVLRRIPRSTPVTIAPAMAATAPSSGPSCTLPSRFSIRLTLYAPVFMARPMPNMAAGGTISALHSGSGPGNGSLDSIMSQSGANQAGNGGDGYFYGGIIHASFVVYQPINIAVAVGYGSSADAEQTNNVSFDQSAVQIAGVGGNGGNGNIASGGNVGSSSSGADMIATGGNSAGNGGDGHFLGSLVNAPVVIYHPINIAHGRSRRHGRGYSVQYG